MSLHEDECTPALAAGRGLDADLADGPWKMVRNFCLDSMLELLDATETVDA
jgi:hypothetical protein